jgi:photosystem II stability/assembly factor-like uncharacterized protein
MSNLNEVLSQAAINPNFPTDNADSAIAIIENIEVVSFSSQSALLFVVFGERQPLDSSLRRTHTAVLKTGDGGENWHLTLDAIGGSFIKDEIFFLNETQGWFLTRWQVAGSFPTLYWTTDFGETWQESLAIHEFITAQGGGASFTEAQGLRFKSDQEGIVVGRNFGTGGEDLLYFLTTSDAGKTWVEIENFPKDYFFWESIHISQFEFSNPFWKITNTLSGFSLDKSIEIFPKVYPAASS